MKVLFTFNIKEDQLKSMETKFTDVEFSFAKKIEEVPLDSYEVIVTYGEDITPAVLEKASSLKWIMVASAGVEKMPLAEIAEKGIIMSNVRGIHKTPMAESVLAHILSLRRALPTFRERQMNKEWNTKASQGELRGSTAIILGPGAIGSEIGRLLQAFGVHTIGCNSSGDHAQHMDETIPFEKLKDVLPKGDIVISVLPSTSKTRGMLDGSYFEAMKDSALFMNFGRGDLVKESTLLHALRHDEIGHAVLDVFEKEPLPADSGLWELENVTISPHVSSHSGKYVERALEFFTENLSKWQKGNRELVNLIDLEQGY